MRWAFSSPSLLRCTLLLSSTFPFFLNAQNTDTETQTAKTGDISFSVGERIQVTGRRSADASRILTSVDRMSGDAIEQADIDYAWELAGRMPGVMLTEFNQGATSGKLSFRGFNGEGEVNAVKLLIDDIPSNSNSGNMPFIDMVLPLEISTLEIVRGTTDPRYGLHNIAGNVHFITRSGGNDGALRVGAGSFGKVDVQGIWGHDADGFRQNYAAGYRQAEGYRDHSDFDRRTLAGKWAWDITDNMTLNASARHYRSDAEEPGYLLQDIAYAQPKATNDYNVSDNGTRDMSQYSLGLHASLTSRTQLNVTSWLNTLEDDRFVTYSADVSQQNRYTDEKHYGVLSTLSYEADVRHLHRLFFEAGASVEAQDNVSRRYLTTNRIVDTKTRDQQFYLRVKGAYLQSQIEPWDWLRITPAWRIDKVSGDFNDNLNTLSAPINDYGTISQPKLSMALIPSDSVTLFANWGRTFQIGVGAGAYLVPPRMADLQPSENEGWEAGVAFKPDNTFNARLTFWNQTATGELKRRLNDPSGDFDNLGATEREGIDVQVAWTPIPSLSLWTTLAWQRAEIETPSPDQPTLAGNDIDHIPDWLYTAGADYFVSAQLVLSLSLRGQSDYELNSQNNAGTFGDFTLMNLTAMYELPNETELTLELKNITDEYYEYVWFDGNQTLHSPGEGRAVSAGITFRF